MMIGEICYDPAPWGTLNHTNLKQIRFINILDRLTFFPDCSSNGIQPYRASPEAVDHRFKHFMINLIQATRINLETLQRFFRECLCYNPIPTHLCKVTYSF